MAGTAARIEIEATPLRSGTERNTATASTTTPVTDPGTVSDIAVTKVSLRPLQLRKTASLRTASTGQVVSFTITVHNPNHATVSDARVCDKLPSQLLLLAAAPRADTRTGAPCWTLKRLRGGGTARFSVRASVAPGARGTAVNRATVTAPGLRRSRARAAVHIIAIPPSPCAAASLAGRFGVRATAQAASMPRDPGIDPSAHAAC